MCSAVAAAGRGRGGRRGGGGQGWRLRHRRRRLQQALRGQPELVRRSALAERKQKFISNQITVKLLMTMSQRIRDVYPGSRILIFMHPGSRISDPGSRIQRQVEFREG